MVSELVTAVNWFLWVKINVIVTARSTLIGSQISIACHAHIDGQFLFVSFSTFGSMCRPLIETLPSTSRGSDEHAQVGPACVARDNSKP
jgi:hypothetical protein